ncbi:MAG: hypothetical protein AAF153_03575 [Pseudomonadota bacterium]
MVDKNGESPLMEATSRYKDDVVKLLIGNGANCLRRNNDGEDALL